MAFSGRSGQRLSSAGPGQSIAPGGDFVAPGALSQALSANQKNSIFNRNAIGWNIRANFGFDLASNTAYGPLIGHFDINSDLGNGFDSPNGSFTYVNTGYVTWAGITAGKAQSFYSFIGGGDNWNNFFSPDQKGFNEPLLLAYTASFGGGFTATLAAQSQGTVGSSGGGTNMTGGYSAGRRRWPGLSSGPTTFGGQRWPDIVGALHVKQGWGEAQVSGVIHNVNVRDYNYFETASCGITGLATCDAQQGKVGWGVDAGVKFNLTNGGWFGGSWGAGDDILFTGSYTRNAVWYSGIPDAMNGENGQVNGNGQPMILADCILQSADQLVVDADRLVRQRVAGAPLDADLLHRSRSLGRPTPVERHGRGRLSCPATCVGTGVLSPHTHHLAPWRRRWLEPGHQPQLRPRVDVSAYEPESAERPYRDGLEHRRVRAGTAGKAPALVSRVASASPVTSDRISIG